MYEALLQSADRPFRATPDTRFYFPSDSVEQARQTILRTVVRAEGPSMVLGGAGFGKSMLCQKFAEDLRERFDVVRLDSNGLCSRRALLQSILFELRLPYRDMNEGELRMSIMDRLTPAPNVAPEGVLLIVDEAQTLPPKLLEELRLITNFARSGQPRARLILVGSMRLEDTFAHPQMDSFNQRLAARCYLQPMTCEQTMEFVRHQFRCVGISPSNIVTSDALKTVYAASEGIPRLVNQVMDHALVLGIANGQCPISASLVEEAWSDLQQLPAPWHTSNSTSETSQSKASLIEFGELREDHEEAFDAVEPTIETRVTSYQQLTVNTLAPTGDDLQSDTELRIAELDDISPTYADPSSDEDEEYEGDVYETDSLENEELLASALGQKEPSFFAAFTPPAINELPSYISGIEADDAQPLPLNSLVTNSQSTNATSDASAGKAIFDASQAFGFQPPAKPIAQTNAPEPTLKFKVSKSTQTEEPASGFFARQASDADMLIVEDAGYDANGFWELDPPIAEKAPLKAKNEEPTVSTIKPELLFGADFEEEIAITGSSPKSTSPSRFVPTATPAASTKSNDNTLLVDDTIASASRRAARAEEQILAMESQLDKSVHSVANDELAAEDSDIEESPATLQLPQTIESLYGNDAIANWTYDVAATEMDREIALHIEIEDLVSQLNFSAFAVEPFSVEQIDINYGRTAQPAKVEHGSAAEAVAGQLNHQSDRETIYTLHTEDSEATTCESIGAVIHNNLTLDDDRDLLIIEEELPLSSKMTSEPPATPPAKVASYSQLFAKLRH